MPNETLNDKVEIERVEQIRLGSHEAFKVLFYEYYPKLFWFVRRYVQIEDTADEIVKELFVELWERRERFVIHSSMKAYLYAAARNRALNYIRANKSRSKYLTLQNIENEELMLIKSGDINPSQQLEQKELEDAVHDAIESLPGRCKLIFTLHRDNSLTYSEIANVMEISPKTVENQMSKALKVLRAKLSHLLGIAVIISEIFRK